MELNEIAAAIHRDMCENESNGYSWRPRWGEDGKGLTTLKLNGKKYTYDQGSYDCSSSCVTAWSTALEGTPWEGALEGATFTGDMRDVFVGSGLFEWKPMSFDACPGDLYLNEKNHVAMCQQNDASGDVLSEFSLPENGDVYNNEVGDQTGWESHICDFYNYKPGGWDGILHFKGAKNSRKPAVTKTEKKKPAKRGKPTSPDYRVFYNGKWSRWVTDGASAGVSGTAIYDFDARYLGQHGWFQLTLEGGRVLERNEHNDRHAKRVIGITVYYDTNNPDKTGYYEAVYRVQTASGAWLKWEHDDDDDGAGDDVNAVCRIQLKIEPCKDDD